MPAKSKKNTITSPSPSDKKRWSELRYENVHQVGGIMTGQLDSPAFGMAMGSTTQASRVALFNTGSGLRFTVSLDRGSDIVDAFFNQHSLAYLSPVGLNPPNAAANTLPSAWINNFPGGLLTTCGPRYIGRPRIEDGQQTTLHGHHSNTSSGVVSLINPDPHRNQNDMSLTTVTRDVCALGHCIEVKRTIRCTLGQASIHIEDEVINRANQPVAHNWLYHVNLGWPLLDVGSRFIYRGKAIYWQHPAQADQSDQSSDPGSSAERYAKLKRVISPLPEHVGGGERGVIVELEADDDGVAHVGLINSSLKLGLELAFPLEQMPRLANWQHYGPMGSYVAGVEPFRGSLMGKDHDDYPGASQYLEPGESRSYQMTMHVHTEREALAAFGKHDGKVTAR